MLDWRSPFAVAEDRNCKTVRLIAPLPRDKSWRSPFAVAEDRNLPGGGVPSQSPDPTGGRRSRWPRIATTPPTSEIRPGQTSSAGGRRSRWPRIATSSPWSFSCLLDGLDAWRSPFAVAEDRNLSWTDAGHKRHKKGSWRSPFAVAEDRNITGTDLGDGRPRVPAWRSPFAVAEDRNYHEGLMPALRKGYWRPWSAALGPAQRHGRGPARGGINLMSKNGGL